jgi:hypothetical protein
MKIIKLTKNYEAIVDDEDYKKFNQHKWYYSASGYAVRDSKSKRLYLHREIMVCPENLYIDHINGDKLDNRKNNLRFCTIIQNGQNSKLRKDNTSGYKGVSYFARDNNWMVRIVVNKKKIHLGYHKTKEVAALVYNNAAIKYFGEFARLNEIKEEEEKNEGT